MDEICEVAAAELEKGIAVADVRFLVERMKEVLQKSLKGPGPGEGAAADASGTS